MIYKMIDSNIVRRIVEGKLTSAAKENEVIFFNIPTFFELITSVEHDKLISALYSNKIYLLLPDSIMLSFNSTSNLYLIKDKYYCHFSNIISTFLSNYLKSFLALALYLTKNEFNNNLISKCYEYMYEDKFDIIVKKILKESYCEEKYKMKDIEINVSII